jgi:hypothetical protein
VSQVDARFKIWCEITIFILLLLVGGYLIYQKINEKSLFDIVRIRIRCLVELDENLQNQQFPLGSDEERLIIFDGVQYVCRKQTNGLVEVQLNPVKSQK